jgi:hypothetical protein
MKQRIKQTGMALAAAAAFGLMMAAPQSAEAQWRRDRSDWGLGRNTGREYTAAVRRLVDRLEQSSNAFREYFERHGRDDRYRDDRYDRRDRYDRGRRPVGRYLGYEELKSRVQHLDESIEDLDRNIGRSDYWTDTRAHVSDVLRRARVVDRAMDDRGMHPAVRDRWRRVAADLNALAAMFGMSGV